MPAVHPPSAEKVPQNLIRFSTGVGSQHMEARTQMRFARAGGEITDAMRFVAEREELAAEIDPR